MTKTRGLTYSRREAAALLAGVPACSASLAGGEARQTLRLGISESLVGDVNLNDARAAMVVWMRRIAKDLNLALDYHPNVFEKAGELAAKLRGGQLDTVAVNILEYREIADWLDLSQITVPTQKTRLEYLLLVRSDSGVSSLAGLRGRRLITLRAPNTCIAPAWLANLLRAEEPGGPERFFSSVVAETKPLRVMLPVFFGQADACLTTGPSFLTMGELNPQVAKRLRPLAASPEIVTTLYAFRRNWDHRTRHQVVQALADLRSSPSGRQVLTMFQCESLVAKDPGCLKSALSIIEQAERAGGKPASRNPKGAT